MSHTLNLRRALEASACALLLAGGACKPADRDTAATGTTTPPATAPAVELRADEIRLGNSIGGDNRVTNETDDFRPTETIYASVRTIGSAPSANITARWTFQDGQVVNEETRTIAPDGSATTEFHIAKPSGWPKGDYKVEFMVDGKSAGTKDFSVK